MKKVKKKKKKIVWKERKEPRALHELHHDTTPMHYVRIELVGWFVITRWRKKNARRDKFELWTYIDADRKTPPLTARFADA